MAFSARSLIWGLLAVIAAPSFGAWASCRDIFATGSEIQQSLSEGAEWLPGFSEAALLDHGGMTVNSFRAGNLLASTWEHYPRGALKVLIQLAREKQALYEKSLEGTDFESPFMHQYVTETLEAYFAMGGRLPTLQEIESNGVSAALAPDFLLTLEALQRSGANPAKSKLIRSSIESDSVGRRRGSDWWLSEKSRMEKLLASAP